MLPTKYLSAAEAAVAVSVTYPHMRSNRSNRGSVKVVCVLLEVEQVAIDIELQEVRHRDSPVKPGRRENCPHAPTREFAPDADPLGSVKLNAFSLHIIHALLAETQTKLN